MHNTSPTQILSFLKKRCPTGCKLQERLLVCLGDGWCSMIGSGAESISRARAATWLPVGWSRPPFGEAPESGFVRLPQSAKQLQQILFAARLRLRLRDFSGPSFSLLHQAYTTVFAQAHFLSFFAFACISCRSFKCYFAAVYS